MAIIDHNKPSDKLDNTKLILKPPYSLLSNLLISIPSASAISWLVCNSSFSGNSTAIFSGSHLLRHESTCGLSAVPILHNWYRSYTNHQPQSFPLSHRILEPCVLIETCLTVSMVDEMILSVGTKNLSTSAIKLSAAALTFVTVQDCFFNNGKAFFFQKSLSFILLDQLSLARSEYRGFQLF